MVFQKITTRDLKMVTVDYKSSRKLLKNLHLKGTENNLHLDVFLNEYPRVRPRGFVEYGRTYLKFT